MLKRKPELDNHDHVFAKYLRDRGWTGDYCHLFNSVHYLVDGKLLAMQFFDNKECTYTVHVPEDSNHG